MLATKATFPNRSPAEWQENELWLAKATSPKFIPKTSMELIHPGGVHHQRRMNVPRNAHCWILTTPPLVEHSAGVLGKESDYMCCFCWLIGSSMAVSCVCNKSLKWGDNISDVGVSHRIPTFSQSPEWANCKELGEKIGFTLIKAHHDNNADNKNLSSSAKQTHHHGGRPLGNSISETTSAAAVVSDEFSMAAEQHFDDG